ncbi:MAG: hypothetical protein IH599_03965, partial [Bacteroidales bacterium]|nr:hypothetical protein [Bacteroidales bacterium]
MGVGPRTLTATYAHIPYTLTLLVAPAQAAAVVVANNPIFNIGVAASDSGVSDYYYDTALNLSAKDMSSVGWKFKGWIDIRGNPPSGINGSSNLSENPAMGVGARTLTAEYEKIQYNLTITNFSNGNGTVKPAPPYPKTYVYDDNLAVSAGNGADTFFRRWGGDTANLQNVDFTVANNNIKNPMYKNTDLTAVFGHTITPTSIGSQILINPADNPYKMDYQDDVTYSIAPKPGYCIDTVTLDGTAVPKYPPVTSIDFIDVDTNHTIAVTHRAPYTVTGIIKDNSVSGEYVLEYARWRAIDKVTGWTSGWQESGVTIPINCAAEEVYVEFNSFTELGAITCWDNPETAKTVSPNQEQKSNTNPVFTGTYEIFTYDLTLGISGDGNGDVEATPGGTGTGKYTYNCGTSVQVEASHAADSDFVNWIGNVNDNSNYVTDLTILRDETVTAVFTEVEYSLSIDASGSGSVTPAAGYYLYNPGTDVTVMATPDIGWAFQYWIGDVADSNSSTTKIRMSENKT